MCCHLCLHQLQCYTGNQKGNVLFRFSLQFFHLVWWYRAQESCWWCARWGKNSCHSFLTVLFTLSPNRSTQVTCPVFVDWYWINFFRLPSKLLCLDFCTYLVYLINWQSVPCVRFGRPEVACLFLFLWESSLRFQIVQVAEIIKEDLWPNPLKYFNNVSIVAYIYLKSFYLVLTLLPTFILKIFLSGPYLLFSGGWRWIRRRWRWRWCKLIILFALCFLATETKSSDSLTNLANNIVARQLFFEHRAITTMASRFMSLFCRSSFPSFDGILWFAVGRGWWRWRRWGELSPVAFGSECCRNFISCLSDGGVAGRKELWDPFGEIFFFGCLT